MEPVHVLIVGSYDAAAAAAVVFEHLRQSLTTPVLK